VMRPVRVFRHVTPCDALPTDYSKLYLEEDGGTYHPLRNLCCAGEKVCTPRIIDNKSTFDDV